MGEVRKYRPANATEGEMFDRKWCDRCERDRAYRLDPDRNPALACPILTNALAYPFDHPNYPPQWIEDDGGPRCTAFVAREEP